MTEESTETEEEIQRKKFAYYTRRRNRELHYQKALLERMERENRKRRLIFTVFLIPLLAMMTSLSLLLLEDKKYIDKEVLQSDISTIISNDGDLDAVKQAFLTQPLVSQIKILFSSKSPYYENEVPLSSVLSDVRVNAFRIDSKEILSKLDPIMLEYEEINPFDKLQVGQKDYFENIRIKSGVEYLKFSNDVNNLADELHRQNMLVNEYLSDSKMAFWISIIAVLLSLLIGGYQIISSRPAAMKKLVLNLLGNADFDSRKDSSKNDHSDE